jgi:hypothetical protein
MQIGTTKHQNSQLAITKETSCFKQKHGWLWALNDNTMTGALTA